MVAKRSEPETTEARREQPMMLVRKPLCPVHLVPMLKGSSPKGIRYRYCPVEGCKESCKEAK